MASKTKAGKANKGGKKSSTKGKAKAKAGSNIDDTFWDTQKAIVAAERRALIEKEKLQKEQQKVLGRSLTYSSLDGIRANLDESKMVESGIASPEHLAQYVFDAGINLSMLEKMQTSDDDEIILQLTNSLLRIKNTPTRKENGELRATATHLSMFNFHGSMDIDIAIQIKVAWNLNPKLGIIETIMHLTSLTKGKYGDAFAVRSAEFSVLDFSLFKYIMNTIVRCNTYLVLKKEEFKMPDLECKKVPTETKKTGDVVHTFMYKRIIDLSDGTKEMYVRTLVLAYSNINKTGPRILQMVKDVQKKIPGAGIVEIDPTETE